MQLENGVDDGPRGNPTLGDLQAKVSVRVVGNGVDDSGLLGIMVEDYSAVWLQGNGVAGAIVLGMEDVGQMGEGGLFGMARHGGRLGEKKGWVNKEFWKFLRGFHFTVFLRSLEILIL